MSKPRAWAASARCAEATPPSDSPEAAAASGTAGAVGSGGLQVANIAVHVYVAAQPQGAARGTPCPAGASTPAEPEPEAERAQMGTPELVEGYTELESCMRASAAAEGGRRRRRKQRV